MKEARDQSEAGREPRNKTITIKRDPSNRPKKGASGRARREIVERWARKENGMSGGWRDRARERERTSRGPQKGDVVDTFCPNYDVNAKLKS